MQQKIGFKNLSLLAILTATVMQISLIVAYKPVMFGEILLPGGVIGFPLVFTIGDVIAEVYGYRLARRILWETLASCALFTFAIAAIIKLPSPTSWHFQLAYDTVFGHLLRIFLAVFGGIIISSFANIYLLSKWKIYLKGKYFWARSFFASAVGELIVTLIADLTAFLGTMPFKEFTHMVLSVYLVKLVYSLLAAILASYAVVFLKRHEGIDAYDYGINFNPFSLKV